MIFLLCTIVKHHQTTISEYMFGSLFPGSPFFPNKPTLWKISQNCSPRKKSSTLVSQMRKKKRMGNIYRITYHKKIAKCRFNEENHTTLKINMEHNHGGLEGHFLFLYEWFVGPMLIFESVHWVSGVEIPTKNKNIKKIPTDPWNIPQIWKRSRQVVQGFLRVCSRGMLESS